MTNVKRRLQRLETERRSGYGAVFVPPELNEETSAILGLQDLTGKRLMRQPGESMQALQARAKEATANSGVWFPLQQHDMESSA